ncbi:putative Exopolysaccharide production protein exoZ [Bradyrhizobium sp. STM 3843]|uniref:acyltransferase family protein n=1 Tax=Bradyrhizobium sp. STM 3843 TaxID=551947 RepID=UPI0002403A26|nr:acyltransferase [Bradyrhizobium sp. STM 3843]CCE08489.1 putative Exopolysaccharide production protein exoZ [Bradyrhizobium sp. STM 3843]
MPSFRQSRIESVQILRAVAAFEVTLAHLSASFSMMGLNPIPGFILGNAGVDLFFVISGFIMVYASEGLFGSPGASGKFMLRRVARIAPLYWAATAFQCSIYFYYGGPGLESIQPVWRNLLASLFFLPIPRETGQVSPILIPGWTLNYEMFFYLIFASLLWLTQRLNVVLALSAALIGLVTLSELIGSFTNSFFWIRYLASPIILEFIFGAWIALAFRSGITLRLRYAIPIALLGIGLICWTESPSPRDRVLTWGIGSALLFVAVVLCDWSNRISPRNVFVQLGEASYSMYIAHWLVLTEPPDILVRTFGPADHRLIYSILILSEVIAVSIISHRVVEKPLTSFLQNCIDRLYRTREARASAGAAMTLSIPSKSTN